MQNILIVCGAGISATFLAKRLRSALTSLDGTEYTVTGTGRDALDLVAESPDIVCLSPVAAGAELEVSEAFPNAQVLQLAQADVAPGNDHGLAATVITKLSTVVALDDNSQKEDLS